MRAKTGLWSCLNTRFVRDTPMCCWSNLLLLWSVQHIWIISGKFFRIISSKSFRYGTSPRMKFPNDLSENRNLPTPIALAFQWLLSGFAKFRLFWGEWIPPKLSFSIIGQTVYSLEGKSHCFWLNPTGNQIWQWNISTIYTWSSH